MLSIRSSGTHSSTPLCVWWILLDKRTNFVHQWSHGRGPGASVWLCCSSAVIWSVSCGILIESEVFHVNPETSRLPSRARSESKGHSLVAFTQRALERGKPHVIPLFVLFSPFAGSPGPADHEPDPDWTPGHIWMQYLFYSFFKHFSPGKEREVNITLIKGRWNGNPEMLFYSCLCFYLPLFCRFGL